VAKDEERRARLDEEGPARGSGHLEDPATMWSAERTLLSWVRTGLAAMAFGFVVARFGVFLREALGAQAEPTHATWAGIAMVALGVLVNVAATFRYAHTLRMLARGEAPRPSRVFPLVVSAGAALIGGLLVALLVIAIEK
jgi:putative membrane protein